MLVLTTCATHGFVVWLNNMCTVYINLFLFYAAPSLHRFYRFCSKFCRAHSHNVIIFQSHQFHLLIKVSVSRNSCTNIPSFAAFRHLFDGDQSAFSFYFVFAYLPVTSYPISLSFESNKLEG